MLAIIVKSESSAHITVSATKVNGRNYFFSRPVEAPKFALGIAHEYGTVWCLEWCPSGCYDETEDQETDELPDDTKSVKDNSEKLRRLGLLAGAFSDGTVRIFSVAVPSELERADSNR